MQFLEWFIIIGVSIREELNEVVRWVAGGWEVFP